VVIRAPFVFSIIDRCNISSHVDADFDLNGEMSVSVIDEVLKSHLIIY